MKLIIHISMNKMFLSLHQQLQLQPQLQQLQLKYVIWARSNNWYHDLLTSNHNSNLCSNKSCQKKKIVGHNTKYRNISEKTI